MRVEEMSGGSPSSQRTRAPSGTASLSPPRRAAGQPPGGAACAGNGVAVLVGRIAVRQEDGCGKGELFLRHAQKRRVAEMHGIERAAEYADCSVFHTPIIHHPRAGEKRFCARGAAWAALFGEKFVREG